MTSRRIESFLLRVVIPNPDSTHHHDWRGRIQHVTSGHEYQFDSFQDIVEFIQSQLVSGTLPPPLIEAPVQSSQAE